MGLPSETACPSGLGLEGVWVGGGWDTWPLGGEGCMAAPHPIPVISVAAFLWRRWGTGQGGLHPVADQAPPPGDTLFCAS